MSIFRSFLQKEVLNLDVLKGAGYLIAAMLGLVEQAGMSSLTN